MKSVYFVTPGSDTWEVPFNINKKISVEEIVKEDFNNFSLSYYTSINFEELKDYHFNFNTFDEAFESFKDGIFNLRGDKYGFFSMVIVEYLLSENDLYKCLFNIKLTLGSLNIKPNKAWYYIWDKDNQKVKELTLKVFI